MNTSITYKVTGHGSFPDDMLRYDEAELLYKESRDALEAEIAARDTDYVRYGTRTFTIMGKRCTEARWNSFGWSVEEL